MMRQESHYRFSIHNLTFSLFQVDDPSGNSFVENPQAPKEDPQLKRTQYKRTKEQNAALGILNEDEVAQAEEKLQEKICPPPEQEEEEESELSMTEENTSEAKDEPESVNDEVLVFSTVCDRCSRPANTNMKVTKIPHFKVFNFSFSKLAPRGCLLFIYFLIAFSGVVIIFPLKRGNQIHCHRQFFILK